jgi:hypothetical protein
MRRLLALLGCCFAFLSTPRHATAAPQIWFAPEDNVPRGANPPKNLDFPHLFDAAPAWSTQADVFAISPAMASVAAPEDLLRRINAFLPRHHMALAVTIAAVRMENPRRVPGECGYGVEGLVRADRNAIYFRRLKAIGMNIEYIAMDEPLTFAHYYNGRGACHYSIEDTARRVAETVAEIRRYYPNVKVVDYEAPNITSPQRWNADFGTWLAAYRAATGTPLDAVVFDVEWQLPWLDWVRPSTTIAHQAGLKVGMFITGTGPGRSDAAAIQARMANARAVDRAKLPLDIVVIANWTTHPYRNLPQSDPTTLTWFLHWYMVHHGR